jgi:UDP-3-O-acyl-N-acetylglucosamine deacetylase
MYLSGYPIIGHFVGSCSSHADTSRLMRQILADPSRWDVVEFDTDNCGQDWSDATGLAAIA